MQNSQQYIHEVSMLAISKKKVSMLALVFSLLLTFTNLYKAECDELISSSSASQATIGAPALYVFGDSFVDGGNNNWLPSGVKCSYLPYGIDFPGHTPTGRATNGKTFPDLIADYLGLPYPPPHKRPDQPKSLTGYNYASGGCGILPESCPFGCIDLDTQVKDFETMVESVLASSFNSQELSQHLSNSIFIVWIGTNDYLLNYFWESSNASTIYSPQQFAQLLVDRLSNKLQTLYNLGARKVIVLEGIPLGCVPYYRMGSVHDEDWCDETMNQNMTLFNEQLAETMQHLKSSLPHSRFTLAKIYQLSVDAYKNPANYGLRDGRNPCCKLAGISPLCEAGAKPCRNHDEYFFWDGAHHTQAAFSLMAEKCINDSSFCFPTNVQQLLQVETIPPYLHSVA